nr:helix-turn-helix domain-containing protein [Salinirubrum litoreum]
MCRDVSKEWEPENVFDVFGSERARQILVLASVEPVSAEEIADRLDTSLPTVYRRVNAMVEYDLLAEDTAIDADGHHYTTYETKLQELCVEIEEGGFTIDIEYRRDLVDKFGDFWGDLGDGDG